MLIAGEPGSGKTMLMQTLAAQISLAGMRVIFINPKGFDTLDGLLEVVPDGERIGLSEIEREGGFFDPFRFVKQTPEGRQVAADIATQHILAVLGSRGTAGLGFTQEQEIALISGMREAAEQGATCVAHALSFVPDAYVREQVLRQASDPLFRLGIAGLDGKAPEPFADSSKLLLIEFDRPLDLPEKGVQPSEYTRTQRLAVAAVRLVTRSAMEILGTSGGGALFVDEAWMFLQSQEGLAALQSLGRLGRSQNILPVFATQRVDDLLKDGIDMQTYLSRVFVLQLSDEKEAAAALKLCQLEPRADRIAWLRQAGPQRLEDGKVVRGAMAVHMDLDGRHAAVLISIPEWLRRTLSSNPEEAKKRRAARQARRLAGSGSTTSAPPQPE
jgi:DNA helicase HerA-like ATPase